MSASSGKWYAVRGQHADDYFLLYPVPGPEETANQVEGLVHLLDLAEGARVLDLACGWGRIAVPLAERGYRLTGIDLSAPFLAMGRREARAAGVRITFRRGDMRKIPFVDEFDAVIMMWSAFGVLESDEEDQKVLDAIGRALRPGGRFLIDQTNRERVMRIYQPRQRQEHDGGVIVLHERALNLLESRNYVRMTIIERNGSRRTYRHVFRLYTLTELANMLARAGLAVRGVWGDFDGSDYGFDSSRMIALAEKER